MPDAPLTIYCNARFSEDATRLLCESISPHRLVSSPSMLQSNLTVPAHEPEARDADVIFGQPHPDDVIQSQRVRWVQLHSAGYTRYDRDELRQALRKRGAVLTNSSSVFDDACAQHVLAFMLAWSRRLPDALLAQTPRHEWAYQQLRREVRVLTGETAIIFGFGAIARRLVELLAPFRMTLIGVRRHVRGDEPIRTVTVADADEQLGHADHIINVLPAGRESIGCFTAARFARINPAGGF
jgi:phosphoglycerate dehydrogenase-like enzyme